jgi:dipeptidyl aminopeptidase/acylaminoacyl peptidase
MKRIQLSVVGACAALMWASQVLSQSTDPQPPVVEKITAEDFGALPFMGSPRISPNGQLLAARASTAGGTALAILALGADKSATTSVPMPEKRDLLWYRWAGNDRILFSIGRSERVMGEDYYVTRLLMMDLKTSQANFIGKKTEGFSGDDVIYVDPEGRSLLLSIQESVFDYPAVFNVDLDTLKMKKVVRPRDNVWEWFADDKGTVRGGIGVEDQRWWLLYRKSADGDFEKVIKHTSKEEDSGDIDKFVMLGGSDEGYVVANKKTGRYGLYHYNFTTDTIGDAIFEHPEVDMDDFDLSRDGQIEAVYFTDDRRRVNWLNPEMKTIQSDIDSALPDRLNRIVSVSRDHERMIVWTASASDPGRYYLFESSTGVMRLLSKPYERITGKPLSAVESTRYRARDGLEIPAYLTLPRGRELKSLPMVVMPHGGPFARDEWSYDVWAQFLANRGYLVLQPNFRGSTGYGKSYVEKGQGQWGRGMQDDIDDGVKWLVEQGKADPKRVCIMGASFGGYAAMWAAARNPDIYRCAISFAGISDVNAMLKYDRKSFSAPRYFRNWRDTVKGDKSFDLDSVSPLRAVDRITIPLLIAHGGKDDNVPPSQSRKLHEAMMKAGKKDEFVVYDEEKHGFEDPKNAVDFLKRVEAFLDAHNPATIADAGGGQSSAVR